MNRLAHPIVTLIFLVVAVPLIFLFTSDTSSAQERGCTVSATKSAPGAGAFEFVFEGTGSGDPFEFTLMDGESTGGTIPLGQTVTITEAPQGGYYFAGIQCDGGPGLVVTEIENGFTLSCTDATDGDATCVVSNLPIIEPVPTLSEWGMISAALGLGLVGVFFALRRRGTAGS
jgi:hypothetical protein